MEWWFFVLKMGTTRVWTGRFVKLYGFSSLLNGDSYAFQLAVVAVEQKAAHRKWRELFLEYGPDLVVLHAVMGELDEDLEWSRLMTADPSVVGKCFASDTTLEERRIRSGAYGRPVRVPVVDLEEPARDGTLGWVYAKPGDFETRWWNHSAK